MKSHTQNFDEYLPEGEKLSPRAEAEQVTLKYWEDNDIFKKTVDKPASSGDYVFYEGPPTANGRPGMHHVEARSFKDLIPRYKTMRGFRVDRKAGWDTHGLPVELQVEKQLGLTSKKQIEEYGIAAFNRACKESVWTYKTEWEAMTTRMGYWVDMDNPYVTYQNSYIEGLWGVLKKVDEKGLLYKDFKVLPWCSRCGTALSTHELNQPGAYQDVKDLSVYAKFKVIENSEKGIGENTYIIAWTTTPWTLPGNVALAVGNDIDYVKVKVDAEFYILAKDLLSVVKAEHELVSEMKGSDLVGLSYEPLFPYLAEQIKGTPEESKLENAYKIYAADFVTTTDGTGVVHTAVMYGADDFDLGTKIGLPKFHTVNEEGKFIDGCDYLTGRFVKEKDESGAETVAIDIIKDLAGRGLLFHKEKYEHSYPHCWRCDTPLLYYARSSWYIRMSSLRDQMVAGNAGINWEPENIREGRFGEWLSGIRDWAISRDRYWGTPIPAWETESGKRVVIGSVHDIKKYAKKSGNQYFGMRHSLSKANVQNIYSGTRDSEVDDLDFENGSEDLIDQAFQKNKNTLSGKEKIVIVTSPFRRARKTAELLVQRLGVDTAEIIIDERLHEWKVGDGFEGKEPAMFHELRKQFKDWYEDILPGGESMKNIVARLGSLFYELENKYQNTTVILVSHMRPLCLAEFMCEGGSAENYPSFHAHYNDFNNAEIRQLDFVPLPHNENYELDFHKPFIDNVELELDGEKLTRTPEVMDVWFDSGAMPFAQYHELGQPLDTEMSGKFPAQFISEAIDQTRGWFYTLHAVASLMDKPRAYENVICLGHIMDANGKKMSKSKGNIISPWKMFANYGADTIRMWMYGVNQPGESKNFDEKTVGELENKFFRMLDNCVAFYDMYAQTVDIADIDPRSSDNVLDQWIIALLDQTNETVTKSLDEYNAFTASRALREFVPELSQWYVRRSRDRVKDESSMDAKFAVATMKYVYKQFALLMAPFAPFAAEDLYKKMGGQLESVHLENWPAQQEVNESVLKEMEKTRSIISSALELRARAGIKVRQPLGSLTITTELADEYRELVKDEVNVQSVIIGSEMNLDTTITPELQKLGDMREVIRTIQQLRKESGLLPGELVVMKASLVVCAFMHDFSSELEKVTVQLESHELTEGVAITINGQSGFIQK
jgi:isoleucyl-tRNA synthetase